MADIFNIAGQIHSTSEEQTAVIASEVKDEQMDKKQSVINQEVDGQLNTPTTGLEDRVRTLEEGATGSGDIEIEANPSGVVAGSGKVTTANAVRGAIDMATGYFECSTAAATVAKTITGASVAGFVLPTIGGSFKVKFTHRNSATNPTLNINSTGAKPIYYNGQAAGAGNTWDDNEIVDVFYDGTNFQCNNVAGNSGDGVFDISVYNASEGTPATYADLADALGTNGANVPVSGRKGGMSVKFVQSSDNKYVQYRLMSDSTAVADFTNVANWQGVDVELIVGSKNLVENSSIAGTIMSIFGMKISPISEEGYIVNNGVYEVNTIQTSDIIHVIKGTRVSCEFSGLTLRYGLFTQKPVENDVAADYGSSTTSPFYINIESDCWLAVSHMSSGIITYKTIGRDFDNNPSEGSRNLIDSGAVKSAIDNVSFHSNEKVKYVDIDSSLDFSNNGIAKTKSVSKELSNGYIDIAIKLGELSVPSEEKTAHDTFEVGGYYNTSGLFIENNGCKYQEIQVVPSKIYEILCNESASQNIQGLTLIGSDNNVIGGIQSLTSLKRFVFVGVTKFVVSHRVNDGNPIYVFSYDNETNSVGQFENVELLQKLCEGWGVFPMHSLEGVTVNGNLFKNAQLIKDGYYIREINSDGTLNYSKNASYRTYLIPVDGTSVYKFTYVRFYVLMQNTKQAISGATVGGSVTQISSDNAAYIAFSFNTTSYPVESYQIGIGSLQQDVEYGMQNLRIGSDNIKDDSVGIKKLSSTVTGKNLFNIDDPDVILGKYLSNNILYEGDGSYNVTGYIKVKPNTTYQCSYDATTPQGYLARFICQYGNDGSYISGSDISLNTAQNYFTTGASTYYIRISLKNSYWQYYQVEEGIGATTWEPFKLSINPSWISTKDIIGSVMKEGLGFKGFSGSATLEQNGSLNLPQSYIRKDISFSALIHGADNQNLDVSFGLGYNAFRGGWLQLTPNKIIVHKYSNSDSTTEYSHGLTLASNVVVVFDSETTQATIKVISDGLIFTQQIDREFYFGGAGFARNAGSEVSVKLSVFPKNINSKVWLFGDSYLSWNDPERWPYWMLQWGYDDWLSDSRPGGGSAEGYVSFRNDIAIGRPLYILWANGMNDGSDTDVSTPNSTWLSIIQSIISQCVELGIVPILATVPTVPTIFHEGKNNWVRNSGYRYIDFAAAVGATSEGVWKTGMLRSDGIHPTELGAKALASQILVDFPEIMVLDN